MSSFSKNIIPRRAHKERAQPSLRASKHGLLEKKSDYKLRARNRNKKRLQIKLLREKAALRNPDEFYYGMISSTTDSGRVRRLRNESEHDAIPIANRTKDQRLLAETQDSRYVSVKCGRERGRLEKLQKGLHLVSMAPNTKRQHILFAEDEDEAEDISKTKTNPKKPSSDQTDELTPRERKRLQKEQNKAYKEMEQRTERYSKLSTVLNDMSLDKKLLSKGRRKILKKADPATGAPAVYKWYQERKR